MFEEAKGFILCQGLEVPKDVNAIRLEDNIWMLDKRLHKFKNDEVLQKERDQWFFLDGYILNKNDICEKKAEIWSQAFIKLMQEEKGLGSLRGAFCGFFGTEDKFTLFVDHVGNRALYYYCKKNILILSSNFYFIVELANYYDILLTVSEQAIKYMLQQGFMLDDTTFAQEIKRVCPGEVVEIQNNKPPVKKKYYMVDNTAAVAEMNEEEAINKIDFYFRQAIRREFDKDREYGYKHLVDLSGGLDSRMTCWCAHQMGYIDQINFTYCRKNYLDYKIAQEIALKLKHTFLFMPLDDFEWYKEVDEILKKNNGAALYSGITGGNRLLRMINCENFGIEHTGMVGDAILSTFYGNGQYNYEKPSGYENVYSKIMNYNVPREIVDGFDNREQFSIYTRGLLGAQSSYFIRQNYVETSSPFLDVDFLNFVFTIPFRYRRRHYIYLKWIGCKYPEAAEFGWEKWFGIKPKLSNLWMKRVINTLNKYVNKVNKRVGYHAERGMNPIDYWLDNDADMQQWINDYFETNRIWLERIPCLKGDVIKVFERGDASEKTQAITALIMVKYITQ